MTYQSTVLIVDDNPTNLEIMEELLFSEPYKLELASNGTKALSMAVEIMPDLILLDVMMPDIDGFEVCKRLRANPLLAEVPIIMVTALDDQESKLQGIKAGADDFVSKPFDRTELRARVKTILRLNRYRLLLSERARFQWVVENATEGYLIVDHEEHILFANKQARHYLNIPIDTPTPIQEKFIPLVKKHYRFLPPKAAGDTLTTLAEAPCEIVLPETTTAPAFWLQIEILDIPSGGKDRWVIRLKDITTEKNLERDVRTFHEMISHKLRTPLMGIVGGLALLLESPQDLSQEDTDYIIRLAYEGGKRLHGEIEDILQYLDAPGRALEEMRLLVVELPEIITKLQKSLELENVQLVIPEALRDEASVLSKYAMELILWEVLENSKKFHPHQTPQVEIKVFQKPDRPQEMIIQCLDDGGQLTPDQLSQIWQPYYQGERYFTGEVKGMGLGLPLVASLITEIGGTITARNRDPGPGVVIEITLPLQTEYPAEI
ncbi:MAG: response regulator [Anaerolineae bacterium]|nr:response regulator [Anaerolineae bacterium]